MHKNGKFKTKLLATSFSLFAMTAFPFAQTTVAHADTSRVNLNSDAPSAAHHGKEIGHTKKDQVLHLTIALTLQHQDELNSLLSSLYDPKSKNYHHFLSSGQFGKMFGASQSSVDQVVAFAQRNGLHVDSVSSENTFVQVSGLTANVEQAFATTINDYQSGDGKVFYANATTPSVPALLTNVVQGVVGFDNEQHWHHAGLQKLAVSHTGAGPSGGYTPTQLRSAYDVSPLISAGTNGSGQTVALFELDGYVQSNISTYDNYYGLGSPAPSPVLVDGYSGAAGQGEGEVELDIEVINALAPNANVRVYEGPNSDQGLIDTYQKIATEDVAQEVSSSWGESELLSSSATMNSMHTIFQQMATQGQSMFAAAGDDGAYDNGDGKLAVDSPANDPLVTGVGGTNLQLNSSGGYSSESVWSNNSTSPPSGGGGGLSTVYSKPTWQTGPGTTNSYSNGMREVPDVSADADPNSGYSIYSGASWVVYGGTSCAAPLWAAITALNNQYATANGRTALGQANPTLYNVFGSTQNYPAFHDVTTGNNLYYPATSGYDQASGIGTPDAYNLIRDINGGGSGGTGGGTSTQLITNGGFENGSSPWVEYSTGGYELVDPSNPHTGSYSAYLAGYYGADDSIYQTISIPSTATSVTLTYWTDVVPSGATSSSDVMKVEVRNGSGGNLSTVQTLNDSTPTGWTEQTLDLTSYKGQTIEVYFEGDTGANTTTNFYVDDVSVVSQ